MDTGKIATDARVRVALEMSLLERLAADARVALMGVQGVVAEPESVRRQLLGRAVRLTGAMAPHATAAANEIRDAFGLRAEVEIYQSAGRENAAMHLLREPILMEIQGRLLSLLDDGALRAVIGHEFGHFIAHGPDSPHAQVSALATYLATAEQVPDDIALLASTLSMARELTADRYALLAARNLDALLRLEMVATTGLPAEALGGDTEGYLAQCRELVEGCLAEGDSAQGTTHPEHGVRAWAAWLFSETDLYRELTGHGSGTRTIAEVDAQIELVLKRPGLDGTFQYLESPPTELHELALAAAVLVAVADEVLSDDESEILEKTFAPLVADWRLLLDPAEAARRMEELAPIAKAWGAAFLRPLFNLLHHVLMADGVIDARELARVAEIGRLLDGEELFGALMRPVMRRAVLEQREEAAAKPLPVHTQDTLPALDAYLAAIVRRGGAQVTMRRLLRMLGGTGRTDAVLDQLAAAMRRATLKSETDLATIPLDQPLALQPAHIAAAAVASPPPTRDALQRAIQRLRDELVSGDGNSPSVRLREIRLGRAFDLAALSRVAIGHGDRCLALALDGHRVPLVRGEQASQSRDAASLLRQLVELRREHLARREETGARDLHLGTGFVRGTIERYVVRAPLLLHPVELEPDGDGGMTLLPVRDEPAVANQALFRLIYLKANLPFSDELAHQLDALAVDPAAGLPALAEHLRQAGVDVFEVDSELHPLDPLNDDMPDWQGRRLELEACAVVGLFPQSRSELLQDYEQLLADLGRPGADAASLLGCANQLLPTSLRQAVETATAEPDAAAPSLVIGADPSQVEVIRMAGSMPALVVDGPPGTGKSQVIVNLVADALARGERVAVVSEKRAALDVVANRLGGIGFDELVGVVHDVVDDRKALFRKIRARLEPKTGENEAAPISTDDPAPLGDLLRPRIAHLRSGRPGEPSLGQLATYAAGIDATIPPNMPPLVDMPAATALKLSRAVAACQPWVDLLAVDSPWRSGEYASRRSLAGSSSTERAAFAEALQHAVQTAESVETMAARQQHDPASSEREVDTILSCNKALPVLKRAGALGGTLLEAKHDVCAPLLALHAAWMSETEAWQAHPAPVRANASPEFADGVHALLTRSTSPLRFLSPGWWKARATVKRQLPGFWPDALGRHIDIPLLRDLHQRLRLADLWRHTDAVLAQTQLASSLGGDAKRVARSLQDISDAADAVRTLRDARRPLEAIGAWLPHDVPAWQKTLLERFAAAQAWRKHAAAIAAAHGIFQHIENHMPAAALRHLHRCFVEQSDRVAELDRHLDEANAIDPRGGLLANACADGKAAQWRDLLMKSWASDHARSGSEALPARLRGGQVDDRATERLSAALELQANANRQRILEQANAAPLLQVAAAEKHARRTPAQAIREKLHHDVSRQRGLPPLRSFVRNYAEQGLFDAIPVWLLSPETLAVLFPRKPVFDIVIFDEASQCTVANGFPALLRARRVAIAGDDKQMPPSAFFKAARNDDTDGYNDSETKASDDPVDFLESESLLTLARQRMPARRLDWHYRCRDEDLIAFSNHAMYSGSLMTCPASAGAPEPPALRWVNVPDAHYEAGRNDTEAEKVVDLIHALLGRPKPPTVGIVTFNLSQRLAILDAIDRRRGADAEFAQRYGTAEAREQLDDRPFVKNIESVQGDERDVIVFSLGHAPVERVHKTRGVQPYVPARFGPLGQRGGERRLNVAVSRAREEAIVVASFHPDQLSVARAKNDGPRLFKAYLEYVYQLSSGARTLAARTLDLVRSSSELARSAPDDVSLPGFVPLAGQVAEALLARGMNATVHVGASRFKVDVAVEGTREGHSYRIAILCDDGDRDDGAYRRTQRATTLRRRGWRVVHVDGIEWFLEREAVLGRIERAMSLPLSSA
jgi:RecA/RadA recombinase